MPIFGGFEQMPRDLKTASYTIVSGDRGKIIEYTGSVAATITLTAAATLGAGWYCILKHSGTGTTGATKRLAISGTLDGVVNPAVYPGDTRIIQSDGTNLTSILLVGGFIQLAASGSSNRTALTLPRSCWWAGSFSLLRRTAPSHSPGRLVRGSSACLLSAPVGLAVSAAPTRPGRVPVVPAVAVPAVTTCCSMHLTCRPA